MPSENKKKILIVRFSSIGDIILTTPVIRCLKLQRPDIDIHYLTKHKYSSLLNQNPYIQKIYTIDKEIGEVLPDLRLEQYDLIIDLHKNLRTLILKLRLLRPSVSYSKLNLKKFLAVCLKINLLPKQHIIDRMMASLKIFNVEYDNRGLDFFVPDGQNQSLLLKEFIDSNPDYFVFSIAGTYYTKRCPNDKVIEICKKIPLPVILTGGESERINGEYIRHEIGVSCFNASGITSVEESAILIEKSRFVISNDTGMMHIAAALKKPVISLWGNTIPQFGMVPLLPDQFNPQPAIIEVHGLKCRPCSKLGFHQCPKKHFNCMNLLNSNDIFTYLSENKLIPTDD
jgi:ADP-heptose:LPS heptosyltransferase